MTYIQRIIWLRYWILLIGQLLGACSCIYFLIKVNEYELSWKLLRTVLPSVAVKIDYILSLTGTYILLIPLTIIILSLLIPESLSLKIVAPFFGTGSTLIMITSGFLRNTFTDSYNLKFFIVTKIFTLEEKRIIFKAEFMRLVNNHYEKQIDLFNRFQEQLAEKYFINYDETLLQLKERVVIKAYANDIVQNLTYMFTNVIIKKGPLITYLTYGGYAISGIVILCIIAAPTQTITKSI